MPNTTGGLAILPQYQGTAYDLQRQQALAGALMQGALQGQPAPQPAGGGYQYVPKASPIAGLSQLGQALMASRVGNQASQGLGNLGQQQWQALVGTNGTGGFGASSSPLQSAPAGQPVDDGTAGVVGVSGQLSGGQHGAQGQQGTPGMLSPGGPMNPLGMPTGQAAMMYLNAPDKYWEAQAAAFKPADINAQIRAAGIDPGSALGRQIAQTALAKTIEPDYVAGRGGGYVLNRTTGQMEQLPQVPEGFTAVRGANGQFQIVPVPGGASAIAQSSAAQASGPATFRMEKVWNPNTKQYELQPATNVSAAAGGAGAAAGGSAPPIPTLPGLGSGAAPGGGATPLPSGPLPGGAGGGASVGGPMAADPPLGTTSNANAAQEASAQTMKTDFDAMQSARQNAPVVLQAYDHLMDLAKRAPAIANGGIGGALASTAAAPYLSSDAAEYDKTRAFLISTLGKDLGKNNSDAARATIAQMIPEYGKPLQAKIDGLQQGRDQVAMKALRASFLTPTFQNGDSKAYTNLANQFDNNVKPSMLPVLQMSGDQQRAAVQASVKANPSLRSSFEWAFNNGLLK